MLFPRFSENTGPVLLGNLIRPIGNIIIHHYHNIGDPTPNTLKSPTDPVGIRPRDHADRYGERSGHPSTLSE
jgi:hypothetical protein